MSRSSEKGRGPKRGRPNQRRSNRDVQRTRLYTIFFRTKRLWQGLLNLVYPDTRAVCALCQRPMAALETEDSGLWARRDVPADEEEAHTLDGVCLFCLQDAAMFSYRRWQGRLRMREDTHGVMPVFCAVTYEGIIRDTIRHWKYDGHIEFTGYLARLVTTALYESQDYAATAWDVVTCVPASPDRLKKRGYHHVGLLVEEVSKQLDVPFQHMLSRPASVSLKSSGHSGTRGKHELTQSQTAKSAKQRRQSLKGQFTLQTQTVTLAGKSILLLDDVITTGATLEACAKVLLDAGAAQVMGIAIAHVE